MATGAANARADWNGDGRADVLAVDEIERLLMFRGNGSGGPGEERAPRESRICATTLEIVTGCSHGTQCISPITTRTGIVIALGLTCETYAP